MENIEIGGLYKHYKGQEYKVHGLVVHSETLEKMVYYECLYENDLGRFWVRPLQIFQETVEVDGVQIPRFSKITTKGS